MLPSNLNVLRNNSRPFRVLGLPLVSNILPARRKFSPLQLRKLAAWYNTSASGMLKSNGSAATSGAAVALVPDLSGNSPVNCLCLNGVAGNYASAPNAAPIQFTGDFFGGAFARFADWTTATRQYFASKDDSGTQRSYNFSITSGALTLRWYPTGASGSQISTVSTVNVSFGAFVAGWVGFTIDVDNGATGNDVKFWTSTDGTTWTQLGATVTTAGVTSIFNSTTALNIGALSSGASYATGNFFRSFLGLGLSMTGTRSFDANFALPAKLATTFTESSSNAATVTINTSGDLGARISGERDLVQLTVANQPVWTSGSGLLFDGTNDYMKAAAFSLSQPETVYFVGQQVTWVSDNRWFDGNTLNSGTLQDFSSTPQVRIYAGANTGITVSPTLATNSVVSSVFNSASSSIRLNRGTAAVGASAGTGNMGGFTLAANATPGAWGNIRANEIAIFSAAHSTSTQNVIIRYFMTKWGIS